MRHKNCILFFDDDDDDDDRSATFILLPNNAQLGADAHPVHNLNNEAK